MTDHILTGLVFGLLVAVVIVSECVILKKIRSPFLARALAIVIGPGILLGALYVVDELFLRGGH